MDMKASSDSDSIASYGGALSVFYGFLVLGLAFGILVLFYVACNKRYRLNWFERNLLETSELNSSRNTLEDGTAGDRRHPEEEECWVPVGKSPHAAHDSTKHSDDESEAASPGTSRGSKTSLALECLREDELQPIARSEKHVVLTTMPAKPLVSMNTKLDLTKIDTSLYEVPSDSSLPKVEIQDRGQVHLSIGYDPPAGILTVRLIQAQNLQSKDFSGTADPYVKIRLLPDRNNVWQTRIHKKTLNPVFDEDFVFEARPNALSRRILEITVYDFDAYSRHQSMGGCKLSLSEIDLTDKIKIWKPLGLCSGQDEKVDLGDLMVSLSFLQSAERLTVVVLKARNLRIVDDSRLSSDPFVKVTLLQGGKRIKKKKTSIHKNTLSPSFNERFTFDVNKDTLSKCSLEFSVFHEAKHGPCELLGRSLVGNSSSCRPEDRQFFQELLTSKAAHARWLVLSDSR